MTKRQSHAELSPDQQHGLDYVKIVSEEQKLQNSLEIENFYPKKLNSLDTRIDALPISTRTRNTLARNCIRTVGDICSMCEKDLLAMRGMGQISLHEIKQLLSKLGLSLSKEVEDIPNFTF